MSFIETFLWCHLELSLLIDAVISIFVHSIITIVCKTKKNYPSVEIVDKYLYICSVKLYCLIYLYSVSKKKLCCNALKLSVEGAMECIIRWKAMLSLEVSWNEIFSLARLVYVHHILKTRQSLYQ